MLVSQIFRISYKSCSWFVVGLSAIDSLINPLLPTPLFSSNSASPQMSCDPLKSRVPYRPDGHRCCCCVRAGSPRIGPWFVAFDNKHGHSTGSVSRVRRREMMVDVDCQLALRGQRRKEDGQAVFTTRKNMQGISHPTWFELQMHGF